ncbi:acyl-homoserine-lactone synthase [Nguyenibacter vanlangensis]|uniref:Acyl-homoserine-lactone synthase n=1 Tax=Nguyenibacter vanlangensis TaxID=1216886 RepID=A0ABZ3D2R0_9PROT
MIKIITCANIACNAQYVASFAKLRYRVFVERLGWTAPDQSSALGFEYDRFDTKDAIYILVCNAQSEVIAGVRLIKTTSHFLLAQLFPTLDPQAIPTGEDVLEVTRFVVEPNRERLGGCSDPVGQLVMALQEFGLNNSLRNFISVSYAGMERLLSQAGCRFARLGGPQRFDGRMAVPLKFEISKDVLSAVQNRLGTPRVEEPIIVPSHPVFVAMAA